MERSGGVEESGIGPDGSSVRALFLRRIHRWTRDLAESAPVSVLADALAHPSARGAMVHVLSEVGAAAEESEAHRLREQALERALVVREQLRQEAGGFHPTSWVAEHMGIRRQSVDKRRQEGKLLALETPQGFEFPACQFTADGTVPGLEAVLGAMRPGGFWETLSGLLTRTPALAGRSILEALQGARSDVERERVVAVARAYTDE